MKNEVRPIDANATIEALRANFQQGSWYGCEEPCYQIAEDTISEMPTIAISPAHIDREMWKPRYIGKWNVDGCNENALATNADQIRAMSDEELAKWLAGQAGKEPSDDPAVWMDWLKQPAEENRP